jgi:Uri superfamily endonuclease
VNEWHGNSRNKKILNKSNMTPRWHKDYLKMTIAVVDRTEEE